LIIAFYGGEPSASGEPSADKEPPRVKSPQQINEKTSALIRADLVITMK
tara:strand:- start:387 stop:533 length:147 start_codon:yes stop_codon:yes gene_type:complete